MLVREESNGLLLVTQPAHSWVSGQLARCWGNAQFGSFTPREEVCLAAELHDIGFLEWERAPTYHPTLRRPHSFMDLPFDPHLNLWIRSVEQMTSLSRYGMLLVSLHVTTLCRNYVTPDNPNQANRIRQFLDQQELIQEGLLKRLSQDPFFAPHATSTPVERNRRLVATWDQLSLLCVLARKGSCAIENVPAAEGLVTLTLRVQPDPFSLTVAPWPFADSEVRIPCEARTVAERFSNEEQMRRELIEALPQTVFLCLSPEQPKES